MKTMKKVFAILLVVLMFASVCSLTAFASDLDGGDQEPETPAATPDTTPITDTSGSITIQNAAKGETYKIFKIFDATISTAATDGVSNSIAYKFTGELPATLSGVFEKIGDTDYVQKKEGATDEAIISAVKAYAATLAPSDTKVAEDGGALVFEDVPFGYYVVTSTQGSAVTVDSVNPNPVIYDKNTKELDAVKKVNGKDEDEVNIGDTVTYTATFNTYNYNGSGKDAKIVKSYTIEDTLPDFLSDVTITSIKVVQVPASEGHGTDGDPDYVAPTEEQSTSLSGYSFGESKKIVIPWVDADGKSLYRNGSQIVVTYTAKVTKAVVVDGTDGNVNKVKITPNEDTEGKEPFEDYAEDTATIFTYAAALQKIDENKKPLAGAKFTVEGLVAEKNAAGDYTVVSYTPGDTSVTPTELECDSDGQLVVIGLKQKDGSTDIKLKLTEKEAPNGYNKLTDTVDWPVKKTGEVITKSERTIKYDEDGKVVSDVSSSATTKNTYNVSLLTLALQVENKKGTELPSTGGIGTTLFYVVGGMLLVGAGVLLVTKKRMEG